MSTPANKGQASAPKSLKHLIEVEVVASQPATDFKSKQPVMDAKTGKPVYEVFYNEVTEKKIGDQVFPQNELVRIKSDIQLAPGKHLCEVDLYPMAEDGKKAQVFYRIRSKR